VDVRPNGIWLALLRDGKLIELHEERGSSEFVVGDIYLGKIRRLSPSLNAAFVDVGYEKDAFLHYLDLGPKFGSLNKYTKDVIRGKQNVAALNYFKPEPEINKDGKIDEVVSSSQFVLVQVAKEPISSKGPRLSSEVTLAGRYIVLSPFSNKISVSQKIKSQEEKKTPERCLGRLASQELWCDYPNRSRKSNAGRVGTGFGATHGKMGGYIQKPQRKQFPQENSRRNQYYFFNST